MTDERSGPAPTPPSHSDGRSLNTKPALKVPTPAPIGPGVFHYQKPKLTDHNSRTGDRTRRHTRKSQEKALPAATALLRTTIRVRLISCCYWRRNFFILATGFSTGRYDRGSALSRVKASSPDSPRTGIPPGLEPPPHPFTKVRLTLVKMLIGQQTRARQSSYAHTYLPIRTTYTLPTYLALAYTFSKNPLQDP